MEDQFKNKKVRVAEKPQSSNPLFPTIYNVEVGKPSYGIQAACTAFGVKPRPVQVYYNYGSIPAVVIPQSLGGMTWQEWRDRCDSMAFDAQGHQDAVNRFAG